MHESPHVFDPQHACQNQHLCMFCVAQQLARWLCISMCICAVRGVLRGYDYSKLLWTTLAYFVQLHACEVALRGQSEVQHPLLDKVRQCSAKPDEAASFFQALLSPVPHHRVKAIHAIWCADAVKEMFAETGTDYKAGISVYMARMGLRPRQRQKPSLCAALCGCFGASRLQSREDDPCLPPKRSEGASASGRAHSSTFDIAASSASEVRDGQPEATALQAKGLQRSAALSLSQRCVRKMKQVCMLKSKRKTSATAEKGSIRAQQELSKSTSSSTCPSAAAAIGEQYTARTTQWQQALQPGSVSVASSARGHAVSLEPQQLPQDTAACVEETVQPNAHRYASFTCSEVGA